MTHRRPNTPLKRVRRINLRSPYSHSRLIQMKRWGTLYARQAMLPILRALRLGRLFDPGAIHVQQETIVIPGLGAGLDELLIAHLSDLHCGGFMSDHAVRDVLEKAWAHKPDLVVFTGDYVEFHPAEIRQLIAPLKDLPHPPLGVYGILGNHDFMHGGVRWLIDALGQAGVRLLRNEVVRIERGGAGIWLVGIDDHWRGQADLSMPISLIDTPEPRILLSHNPDVVGHARDHNFALMLSGHTHGGQIVLPILGPAKVYSVNGPEFIGGSICVPPTHLHVSRGIGTTSLPIRIGCPPEFSMLRLTSSPESGSAS